MSMSSSSYDVVVIGGGPAGSTTSTLLAQHGLKVGLFEREKFPRFHIGESLIPETYWVLKRLNMLPKMQRSHFVKKYSVQFVNANGKLSAPFYFWDNKPHECSQTWQVVRSEFDQMMLDNAREHGVEAHEGVHVVDVLFEGDRAVRRAHCRRANGRREIRAKVVVDASGQAALLQNRFKLRVWDPMLNKGAIWTYWQGAYRDTGRDEGATMVLQTVDEERLVLVHPAARRHRQRRRGGAVRLSVQGTRAVTSRRITRKSSAARPSRTASAKATRVTGYFATRDYSYRAKEVAGDGWVLVGDAFGFLDPLYSSGRAAGAEVGRDGGRRHRRRAGEEETSARRSSASGARASTRAWIACAGWSASTTTASASARSSASTRAARHGDRPADRRPVHGPRRQGLAADGVALRAGTSTTFRHGTRARRQTRSTAR